MKKKFDNKIILFSAIFLIIGLFTGYLYASDNNTNITEVYVSNDFSEPYKTNLEEIIFSSTGHSFGLELVNYPLSADIVIVPFGDDLIGKTDKKIIIYTPSLMLENSTLQPDPNFIDSGFWDYSKNIAPNDFLVYEQGLPGDRVIEITDGYDTYTVLSVDDGSVYIGFINELEGEPTFSLNLIFESINYLK